MSNDNILAQQFWAWPDPVMKRDAQGRVIFVNAAFLQIYGGTVEAWTGNVLQGWSAPPRLVSGAFPQPTRFETRIPSPDGSMTEYVFDWLEQGEANGSALAIARNVTLFMTNHQPSPTHAPQASADVETSPPVSEPQRQTQEPARQSTPQQEPAPVIAPASRQEPAPAPNQPTPVQNEAAIADAYQQDESAFSEFDSAQELDPQPEYAPTSTLPHYEEETEAHYEPATRAPQQTDPYSLDDTPIPQAREAAHAQPPVQVPAREERDFQRRALPMESNNSILGNNWRDAVIAKAIGTEPQEEDLKETISTPEGNNGVQPIHILLAEDNAINALLTRTLLEAEGHTVETVEDGVLAVEAMKSQSYDLIFMDMRMPNMDGLEATRKIRQLPNVSRNLPIIALTANAFDDDRNACFDSGMNDFMTKPVSAEELSEMVLNWANKDEVARSAA